MTIRMIASKAIEVLTAGIGPLRGGNHPPVPSLQNPALLAQPRLPLERPVCPKANLGLCHHPSRWLQLLRRAQPQRQQENPGGTPPRGCPFHQLGTDSPNRHKEQVSVRSHRTKLQEKSTAPRRAPAYGDTSSPEGLSSPGRLASPSGVSSASAPTTGCSTASLSRCLWRRSSSTN